MIRNVVFDMGNVLIRWDPEYFVARAGVTDPQDARLLLDNIYRTPEWVMLDSGAVNEEQVYEKACAGLPERLHDLAWQLVFRWHDPIEPIPGMADFVQKCKVAGLGVYLLSNASFRQKDYWPRIPGSALFDGRVVSAEAGWMKPSREIYALLTEIYGLKAEECVFVDDIAANVMGAMRAGMHALLFDGDVDQLKRRICLLGADFGA